MPGDPGIRHRQSLKPSIPVLMYHHVAPGGGNHSVHPDRFKAQIRWLLAAGYAPISGSRFQAYRRGAWKPAGRAVLITFDDGWLDNWCYAYPVLEQFRVPVITFVVSSWPGEGPARRHLVGAGNWRAPSHGEAVGMLGTARRDEAVMRWSELQSARESGLVEMQSHSHTHGGWWNRRIRAGDDPAPMEMLREDLLTSKAVLHRQMGMEPTQLCWPSGRFTTGAVQLARTLGFEDQYSTLRGSNRAGYGHRLVRRLHVEDRGLEWFSSRLRLYAMPIVPDILGWIHQQIHGWRMRRHSSGQPRSAFPSTATGLRLK